MSDTTHKKQHNNFAKKYNLNQELSDSESDQTFGTFSNTQCFGHILLSAKMLLKFDTHSYIK